MCARCEALEETVRQLRAELRGVVTIEQVLRVRNAFRLTPAEGQFVMALYGAGNRTVASYQLLDETSGEDALLNTLRVRATHIRRKVGPDFFEAVWGLGYRLTPVGRARIYQLLKPREGAA